MCIRDSSFPHSVFDGLGHGWIVECSACLVSNNNWINDLLSHRGCSDSEDCSGEADADHGFLLALLRIPHSGCVVTTQLLRRIDMAGANVLMSCRRRIDVGLAAELPKVVLMSDHTGFGWGLWSTCFC